MTPEVSGCEIHLFLEMTHTHTTSVSQCSVIKQAFSVLERHNKPVHSQHVKHFLATAASHSSGNNLRLIKARIIQFISHNTDEELPPGNSRNHRTSQSAPTDPAVDSSSWPRKLGCYQPTSALKAPALSRFLFFMNDCVSLHHLFIHKSCHEAQLRRVSRSKIITDRPLESSKRGAGVLRGPSTPKLTK